MRLGHLGRALVLLTILLFGSTASAGKPGAELAGEWIGVWGTAPYGPYPLGPLSGMAPSAITSLTSPLAFAGEQARDQSFRMIVRPTLGGSRLRLRFSNLVGESPLQIGRVSVAIRLAHAAIVPGSQATILFDGAAGTTIAPGAERISDPLDFVFTPEQDLVISFYLPGETGPMTWHAVSFDTQYLSAPDAGDVTDDPTGARFPHPTVGWFFLTGVDVDANSLPVAAMPAGTIVALGDSITDGAYQVPASNTRWPDWFARRLRDNGLAMGVLNKGINSNTVTEVGPEPYRGAPAVVRFGRDVLDQANVRSLVLFEGTNDLTAGASAEVVYAGIRDLVERAQDAGICVVVGTIPPRDDLIFGWNRELYEAERQRLNAYLRADASFDGIADFDVALGNPLEPSRPNPALFSPDLLHPNSAGFQVMADAVPLRPLLPAPFGECDRRGRKPAMPPGRGRAAAAAASN